MAAVKNVALVHGGFVDGAGWEGVYRVLKPHLIDVYAAHLARANPVYEPPTRRILERCLADERRHVRRTRRLSSHSCKTRSTIDS